MMVLSFPRFLSWVLVLLYTGENGGDLHELTGKILFQPLIIYMVCIVTINCCHTSHCFVCGWLQVLGSVERVMDQILSSVPV